MKIRIIQPVAGMEVGIEKDVDDLRGQRMIDRGHAEKVDGAKPKAEKVEKPKAEKEETGKPAKKTAKK